MRPKSMETPDLLKRRTDQTKGKHRPSEGKLEQIEIEMGIFVSNSKKMECRIRRWVAADGEGPDSKRVNRELDSNEIDERDLHNP
jgi:hypothetical protein